jgi:Cof subfamily protein (haloacid dehalogenase superfamily)
MTIEITPQNQTALLSLDMRPLHPYHHPHHPYPYRLLALDMDDTLLRTDGTISQRTLAALDSWREAGNTIVIATGRPTRSIATVLPESLHSVPWITYNGAYIFLKGECIYENLIAPADTHAIIDLVKEALPDCALGLEIDNTLFLNRTINRTSPYEVVDLVSVAHQPAAKILFFHQEFGTLENVLSLLPTDTRAMLSDKYNLVQILAATADKTHALRYLITQLGLEMAQVVAIGDDINDVDMIRDSGLGVAVENAIPAVKAVAKRLTATNDEEGVALVIEELLQGHFPQ